MDRKRIRKLLGLSCFANIFLCIFIVLHFHTSPQYNLSSKQIGFNHNRLGVTRDKLKQGFRTEQTMKKDNVNPQHGNTSSFYNETKNRPERDKIMFKDSSESGGFDPSFAFHFQARSLPPRDVSELFLRPVPNMVYFVWCGKNTFSYRHFLSVYSVWFHLEPDVIEIHFEFPPLEDKYNTWLSWLRGNIPSLSLHALPSHVTGSRCGTSFGMEIVEDRGGLFLDNGVTLHSSSRSGFHSILHEFRSFSFFPDGSLAMAAAAKGDFSIKHYLSLPDIQKKSQPISAHFRTSKNALIFNCTQQTSVKTNTKTSHFLDLDILMTPLKESHNIFCVKFHKELHPIDIFQENSSLTARIIERMFNNGDGHANKTGQGSGGKANTKIPNIIHYIWFGKRDMTFSMYLSFLSSVHIVKPDAIVIHTDMKLYGKYWKLVVNHPLIRLVYREMPSFIYQHRLFYAQHRSDIVRADILDKYGGVYLDWDAFWLKSPTDLFGPNKYDVILSRDHIPRLPFPDTINMGVALAKPRSKFIRAWRAAWVNYRSRDFLYNAVELPYKIYEMFPHSTFLHDNLQVMCYFLKCHPLFHPDHKHWGRGQPFDWKKDVYAIHFTHPDPPAFQNETALWSGQGMFADIGKYIWNSSQ